MRVNKSLISGKYEKLYYTLSAILFEHDIEGINFEVNDDEYEPEVDTILPRLPDTETVEDVQLVIQQEFAKWFGEQRELEEFQLVAKDIWVAWHTYKTGML